MNEPFDILSPEEQSKSMTDSEMIHLIGDIIAYHERDLDMLKDMIVALWEYTSKMVNDDVQEAVVKSLAQDVIQNKLQEFQKYINSLGVKIEDSQKGFELYVMDKVNKPPTNQSSDPF